MNQDSNTRTDAIIIGILITLLVCTTAITIMTTHKSPQGIGNMQPRSISVTAQK